jgi:uncharacterized phage protein (TIGR02218 family)
MSRTLSVGLAAHIATNTHRRVMMLRLDLHDGTSIGLCDHDLALNFDLGDGAIDYEPNTGILTSDVTWTTGFGADDVEITGPIADIVTRAGVLGGRFDDAAARLFFVDWATLGNGAGKLLKGRVVRADVIGGRFTLTIHSNVGRFSQRVGRTVTGICDAEYGDTRCGDTPFTLAATVAGVTSRRVFSVTFTGTYANDFFNFGRVSFNTGGLAGVRPIEIFDFTGGAGTGAVKLWTPAAELPEIGDTLTLTQGCEKTRAACMAYSNIENFRGFPEVPGSDQVLSYPVPSA